jgi:hypothetical protein
VSCWFLFQRNHKHVSIKLNKKLHQVFFVRLHARRSLLWTGRKEDFSDLHDRRLEHPLNLGQTHNTSQLFRRATRQHHVLTRYGPGRGRDSYRDQLSESLNLSYTFTRSLRSTKRTPYVEAMPIPSVTWHQRLYCWADFLKFYTWKTFAKSCQAIPILGHTDQ